MIFWLILLIEVSMCGTSALAQDPPLTFHSSSKLVLVNVIARNPKNGLPDKTLTRADFELFDSGHPVPIKTLRSYGWLLSQ